MSLCAKCQAPTLTRKVEPAVPGAVPVYLQTCPKCDRRQCPQCRQYVQNIKATKCDKGHRL